MSECSRTKKIEADMHNLPTGRVGKLKNLSKSKWDMAKMGIVTYPWSWWKFYWWFQRTGSRSAHLINKDSACAKAKKIAFVENEKWIKPAEKLCVRTAASDKGGSEFKPSWWSAAFCRFLPQSKNMHRRSKADAERSSDAECQGGCIDEWACCINHIKLWLFQRSEDLLD